MKAKFLEIRDRHTFIPVVALQMKAASGNLEQFYYVHWRSGYAIDGSGIVLMRLSDQRAHCDPYDWGSGDRSHVVAHDYICKHFDELKDGDVIDVEFILGETEEKKISERYEEGSWQGGC